MPEVLLAELWERTKDFDAQKQSTSTMKIMYKYKIWHFI